MNIIQHGSDWHVVDDDRTLGVFGSNAAAWRFVDRQRGELLNKAQQRSEHGFRRSVEASDLAAKSKASRKRNRRAPRDHNGWQWPEGLYPLRDWLAAHHVDVGSVKTARQALFLAQQLGKIRRRMPKRGDEFRALMAVQRTLTGSGRGRPAPMAKTYERGFGTFGPAGEVRRIDPSTYPSGGAG